MNFPAVVLRAMRQDEYDAYSDQQIRGYVESLSRSYSAEAALAKAHQDLAQFLPHGLATERHRLVVAENAAGQTVGYAWFGLDDPRSGSSETAWLYDIRVEPAFRRSGYGTAILAAVEAMARELGALRLGLNVFSHNQAAINLYERSGYQVTARRMAKLLR